MKKSVATRQLFASLLALLIFLQPIASAAAIESYRNTAHSNEPPVETVTPQNSTFGVELTALNTAFNNHASIDYHHRTRKVVVSANSTLGQPNNFELIQADGTRTGQSDALQL